MDVFPQKNWTTLREFSDKVLKPLYKKATKKPKTKVKEEPVSKSTKKRFMKEERKYEKEAQK
ncbi:MAG: hypothetical protein ACTSRK_21180, partial [Promethearchaeota archaeon]